jgi:hypothetical protein
MTLTDPQRSELERLRRKYRVQFDQPLPKTPLPPEPQRIFDKVLELAKITYDEYAIGPEELHAEQPWKLESKNLASRVVSEADRCRRRNEATWRYACEPLVFTRGSTDVAW